MLSWLQGNKASIVYLIFLIEMVEDITHHRWRLARWTAMCSSPWPAGLRDAASHCGANGKEIKVSWGLESFTWCRECSVTWLERRWEERGRPCLSSVNYCRRKSIMVRTGSENRRGCWANWGEDRLSLSSWELGHSASNIKLHAPLFGFITWCRQQLCPSGRIQTVNQCFYCVLFKNYFP